MDRSKLAIWNDPKREVQIVRWGLAGASTIAAEHMIGAFRVCGGEIAWVMSASADHAADYAAKHWINRSGTDLDALLSAPDVDAVYISSTNEKHLPQAMAAGKTGKLMQRKSRTK